MAEENRERIRFDQCDVDEFFIKQRKTFTEKDIRRFLKRLISRSHPNYHHELTHYIENLNEEDFMIYKKKIREYRDDSIPITGTDVINISDSEDTGLIFSLEIGGY